VVAGLLGVVLLLFELVLIARMVVDWIGVLSRTAAAAVSTRHAGLPTASPSRNARSRTGC